MKKNEKMSEELKRRCGFKKGYTPWNKGLTGETDFRVKAQGSFRIGHVPWNKGKEWLEFRGKNHPLYGKCRTQETRNNISIALTGKALSEDRIKKISEGNTGKIIPIEQRIKIGQGRRKFFKTTAGEIEKKRISDYNKNHYEDHLGKISYEQRLEIVSRVRKNLAKEHQTVIESLLEKELIGRNLKYIPEHIILNYIVDFFLPDFNMVIEADGDYWHNYPNGLEKDRIRDKVLINAGYKVYRFWEHEIKESPENCINKITELRRE